MLCTIGDLVEDVVVWLDEPIQPAADTACRIFWRRGGSAANVAAFAAAAGASTRFVGQVGDDGAGQRLTAGLAAGDRRQGDPVGEHGNDRRARGW